MIDPRFRGPPDSANGGYTCGLMAQFVNGAAEVTLRAPPPLAEVLQVEEREDEVVLLRDGALIAQARPARFDGDVLEFDGDVPEPVALQEAELAASRYPWRKGHPYPTCFVCGPERDPGDGLGIFPGPVEDGSSYAAPWTPDSSLADPGGIIPSEFVWAALDCPSGIVTDLLGDHGLLLLGRLAAKLRERVMLGSRYVVQAWPLSRDGRKLRTSSAVFSTDREACAVAQAVWIELRANS